MTPCPLVDAYAPHHPAAQKLSIATTLYSRADNIMSKQEHKQAEFDHTNQTLQNNDFLRTCILAISFLLSRLNLILNLNLLIHSAFISIL